MGSATQPLRLLRVIPESIRLTISGFVPLEKRGEQTRLLDFLNGYAKRFIPVFWGEHVWLVNRFLIASVSQLT